MLPSPDPISAGLSLLAAAHGVATSYEDSSDQLVHVAEQAVVDVLGALGIDATSPAAVSASLAAVRARQSEGQLQPTMVVRVGTGRNLPDDGVVTREDGTVLDVERHLPDDLPLGWHRLTCAGSEITLVVVPERLPEPPSAWGWMLQLYALHSHASWGMGDLGDLAAFTAWAGRTGAGFVQLNPLHAVAPTFPVQASPYSPTSRRFTSPLYLRVSDIDAYRTGDPELRGAVDALSPGETAIIDYDAVWQAKKQALELLFAAAAPTGDDNDPELAAFATFSALAEEHGPDWRAWPPSLQQPDGADVAQAANDLAPRVAFYAWLQRQCQQQLDAATTAADQSGMSIGIVHDLAVGVDPGGADAWMLGDVLVAGVRVGAPPDSFNQLGQDWGLAAWHPTRLAETGYAAYRDMLRRTLRHAGGIRIDHIAGLFRLWWIPPTAGAAGGTYVSYDAEAMLGILTLEAARAGAVVIGEDLGTVPPAVTAALQERAMLGSTVLWFSREGADPQAPFTPPAGWPRHALASISTHDLPTAYGYLAGEHIRVRMELQLLAGSVADERSRADAERALLLEMLAPWLPSDNPDADEIVAAMHAALVASPSLLVAASLYDVVGELRQPNLPGTVDQYPNWRLPLPLRLEEIAAEPHVPRIVRLLAARRTSEG